MLKTLSSIAALLLAIAYLALGNGLFSTLLSVRSSLQFGSTETTGAIMSSYFLGLVVGVFWCREVIRKVGHIRAFAAFAALLSILPLCHAFVVNPWAWAFFRVIAGLCLSGVFMVAESWVNERATNQIRGQVLSFYMITFLSGARERPVSDQSGRHPKGQLVCPRIGAVFGCDYSHFLDAVRGTGACP